MDKQLIKMSRMDKALSSMLNEITTKYDKNATGHIANDKINITTTIPEEQLNKLIIKHFVEPYSLEVNGEPDETETRK